MKPRYVILSTLMLLGFNANGYAEKVNHWVDQKTSVKLNLEKGTLVLTPQNDNAIRVQYVCSNENPLPEYVFLNQPKSVNYTVKENNNLIEISIPKLTASIDKKKGHVVFKNDKNQIILSEKIDGRMMYNTELKKEETFFVEQKFESPKDEYIYGTGQFQDGYLNIRGLSRRLTQLNTQISIPFILSSKGYGLLWHNYGLTYFNPLDKKVILKHLDKVGESQVVNVTTTEGVKKEVRELNYFSGKLSLSRGGKYAIMLDVGNRMAGKHNIKIDGKQIVAVVNKWLPRTTSLIVELSAGEHDILVEADKKDKPIFFYKEVEDQTVFRSPVADCLDYTVFSGYGDEVISSYRNLTGNAPMMPKWAMGYIHCRERFDTQKELLTTAKEFRKREIPIDVIVQDWLYWGKYGWNAMQFDENKYPNPKKMVDELHKMNMRLMVSVWSRVYHYSAVGTDLRKNNCYINGTQWIDFYNPKAAACYWKNFSKNLLPVGIDAWWQDATEPENDDIQGRMVANNTLNGDRVRNIYPLLVCKTVYEGLRKDQPYKRAMILTRSGYSGMQRYAAATWSGDVGHDWETLRRQIAGGLNYMASGMPWWTYDAGGFFRPRNGQYEDEHYRECLIRWFEASTFLPLQRVHGLKTNTEFWNYGSQVESIAKKYLNFRYRMMPYIYSEAAAVTFKGSTLMRPFIMDFPHDKRALECKHSFMFGPSLLVAPVVNPGVKERETYLPDKKQVWFDFWTGEKHQGGNLISVPVTIDKIPLFAKAGSIIPLGEPKQHTEENDKDVWEIRIYPGADAEYTIYEDEGTNYNYEKGQYSTYTLKWNDKEETLTITDRTGSFDDMVKKRTLRVVRVSSQKGLGFDASKNIDKKVVYKGSKITLKLGQ